MYNKEELIKSIQEVINNDYKDLSKEEIKHLENIRDNIAKSQNDKDELKWNFILAVFLTIEKLDNKMRKSEMQDKLFKWGYLLIKLLILLASVFYHKI